MRALGLLVLCVSGFGCLSVSSGDDDEAAAAPPQASGGALLDSLRAEISATVGEPRASALASCRALPFGAKPCGGPWTYLIFSVETADSATVASLLERYRRIEARLNEEEGRISDCAFVTRPALVIRDGICVAESRGT